MRSFFFIACLIVLYKFLPDARRDFGDGSGIAWRTRVVTVRR